MRCKIALIGDSITDRMYAQGVTGLPDAQNKQQLGQGIDEYLHKMLIQSTVENFGISSAYMGYDFRTNLQDNKLQYMNIKLDSNDPRESSYHHLKATFDRNLLGYIVEQAFHDVIIMLGTNDITRSPESLFGDIGNVLGHMIDQLLENKKTRVHLFAPPNRKTPHLKQPAFVAMLRTVAARKQNNPRFTGLHEPTDIDPDNFVNEGLGIHPNTNGLKRIAADMHKILAQTSGPVPTPNNPGVTPTRPLTQYPDWSLPLPASTPNVYLQWPDAYSWFPREGRKGVLVQYKSSDGAFKRIDTKQDVQMHLLYMNDTRTNAQVRRDDSRYDPRQNTMSLQILPELTYKDLYDLIVQDKETWAVQPRTPVPHVPHAVPGKPVQSSDKVIVCIGDSNIDSAFAKSKNLRTSVPAELQALFDRSSTNQVKIIDLARGGIHMTNYLKFNCGSYDASGGRDPKFHSGCTFADTYEQWIQKPKHKVTDYVIMLGTNDITNEASFNADAFRKAATNLIQLCSRGGARIFVFTPPHFRPSAVLNPNIEQNRTSVKEILRQACASTNASTNKCTFVETRGFEEVDFHDYVHFNNIGMQKLAGYFHDALTGALIPVDPSDPMIPALPFAPPPAFTTPPAFTSPIVSAQVELPFTQLNPKPESHSHFDMYQVISQSGYFFTYRDTNDQNTSVSLYFLDTTNMIFRQMRIATPYVTPLKGTLAGKKYTIKNIFGTAIEGDYVEVEKIQMSFGIFPHFKPPALVPPSQVPPAVVPPSQVPPSVVPPAVVPPAVVLPQPTRRPLPFTSPNRDGTIQMYKVLGTNLQLYFTYAYPYTVALYQDNRGLNLEEISTRWLLQQPVYAIDIGDGKFGGVTNFLHADLANERDIQIERVVMQLGRLPPAVIQPVPVVPQPVMQPAVPLPFDRPTQPLPAVPPADVQPPAFVPLPQSSEGGIYKIDDTKGFVWVPGEDFSGDYTEVVKDGDYWQKSKSQKRTVRYAYDELLQREGKFRIRMDGKKIVAEQVHGVQFKEYSEERNFFEKVWDGIKDFFDLEWYFIVGAIVGICIVLAFVYVCIKVMFKRK